MTYLPNDSGEEAADQTENNDVSWPLFFINWSFTSALIFLEDK